MGIAEYLGDRKEPSQFEGAKSLFQHGGLIGHLAQHSAQVDEVEARFGNVGLGGVAK